jgi:hypothetical protein
VPEFLHRVSSSLAIERHLVVCAVGLPMRTEFLVCYDVVNDKRLRRTYKKTRGFGTRFSIPCSDVS